MTLKDMFCVNADNNCSPRS